jgi:cardiolipin synthase
MILLLQDVIRIVDIVLVIYMIFQERREAISLFAWLMFFMVCPITGFILYILFGSGLKYYNRQKRLKRIQVDTLFPGQMKQQELLLEKIDVSKVLYGDLIKFNTNFGKSLLTSKNEIKIYTDGKSKYDDLLNDIASAKHSIHILYFIIKNDTIGKQLVDALVKKAKQGVEVRVVYDDAGCFTTPHSMFKTLISEGGRVLKFLPSIFKVLGLNLNYRNHRKIVVIDGQIGYTGGMNIGDEYMSLHKRLKPWRDTHIRIVGETVNMLQIRFLQDYMFALKDEEEAKKIRENIRSYLPKTTCTTELHMQIVNSGPDLKTEDIKSAYVKMIYSAKKCIYIETPYFVPDCIFMHAIKSASLAGIDVHILLPSIPDKRFVYRATTSYIEELLDAGIKVYLYQGFLHSKCIVIDDVITAIGSTNIDTRSFKINFEISAFVYDPDFTKKMMTIIRKDMEASEEVTKEDEKNKPAWIKYEESICRLLYFMM